MNCSLRKTTGLGWLAAMAACATVAAAEPQASIAWVEKMPGVPQPLHILDWRLTASNYYRLVFDPAARGPGLPAVALTSDRSRFGFPAYLNPGRKPDPTGGEAIACLAGVAGAQLVGLDMRGLHGLDWARSCLAWFSEADGVYQNRIGQKGGVISHVIYGYWPLALGVMLTDLNRDDPAYRQNLGRQFAFVLQMAQDMGCPEHPNLEQGYDIAARRTTATGLDWNPGNASCLAWMLYAGHQWTGQAGYLACARAALRWQLEHPGRYEISHAMGPLVMARLNAEHGDHFDLARMLDNWFGDYTRLPGFVHHWAITHGTRLDGRHCDGLDGAWWRKPEGNGFYAFAMGSYQAPAWLLPLVRYDQRFARAAARYALNAANSCRFFLGLDLDWDHQDHWEWRQSLPDGQGFLFSYEGFRTEAHHADAGHRFQPYATGDPLALFSRKYSPANRAQYWLDKTSFSQTPDNISLYMGHHIGFLGAICQPTEVPGIIVWNLTKTDYYRPPCYPTFLAHNPYGEPKTIPFDVGDAACDLYDTVAGRFLRRQARGRLSIPCAANQAQVIVLAPAGGRPTREGSKFLIDGVVVDYRKMD